MVFSKRGIKIVIGLVGTIRLNTVGVSSMNIRRP